MSISYSLKRKWQFIIGLSLLLLVMIMIVGIATSSFNIIGEKAFARSVEVVERKIQINKVIDGDTMWIQFKGKKKKLRLVGIDAFESYIYNEKSQKKVERQAKEYKISVQEVLRRGVQAKNTVNDLVSRWKANKIPLILKIKKGKKGYCRGKYGRLVGDVLFGEEKISLVQYLLDRHLVHSVSWRECY